MTGMFDAASCSRLDMLSKIFRHHLSSSESRAVWVIPDLPEERLQRARRFFASLADDERPIALVDGHPRALDGKTGHVFTDRGLHFDGDHHEPRFVSYQSLDLLELHRWFISAKTRTGESHAMYGAYSYKFRKSIVAAVTEAQTSLGFQNARSVQGSGEARSGKAGDGSVARDAATTSKTTLSALDFAFDHPKGVLLGLAILVGVLYLIISSAVGHSSEPYGDTARLSESAYISEVVELTSDAINAANVLSTLSSTKMNDGLLHDVSSAHTDLRIAAVALSGLVPPESMEENHLLYVKSEADNVIEDGQLMGTYLDNASGFTLSTARSEREIRWAETQTLEQGTNKVVETARDRKSVV
jgi:hypothetical protein